MADDRSLSDLMWDYGVYAPIGLVVSIAEEFPRLSEKGKEHAASQIHLARAIGKMAVGQGKRRFGKVFGGGARSGDRERIDRRPGGPPDQPVKEREEPGQRERPGRHPHRRARRPWQPAPVVHQAAVHQAAVHQAAVPSAGGYTCG